MGDLCSLPGRSIVQIDHIVSLMLIRQDALDAQCCITKITKCFDLLLWMMLTRERGCCVRYAANPLDRLRIVDLQRIIRLITTESWWGLHRFGAKTLRFG